jgi:hypothetical protein
VAASTTAARPTSPSYRGAAHWRLAHRGGPGCRRAWSSCTGSGTAGHRRGPRQLPAPHAGQQPPVVVAGLLAARSPGRADPRSRGRSRRAGPPRGRGDGAAGARRPAGPAARCWCCASSRTCRRRRSPTCSAARPGRSRPTPTVASAGSASSSAPNASRRSRNLTMFSTGRPAGGVTADENRSHRQPGRGAPAMGLHPGRDPEQAVRALLLAASTTSRQRPTCCARSGAGPGGTARWCRRWQRSPRSACWRPPR